MREDLRIIWSLRWDIVAMVDEVNHLVLGRYYIQWLCEWNQRRMIEGTDEPFGQEDN